MVVAVALVRVVQATIDQEVDVVAVRHGIVAAALAVEVAAAMVGCVAAVRVQLVHGQPVFVDVVAVGVVQVAVVEEVDVAVVDDLRMAAPGPVDVLVGAVNVAFGAHGRHGTPPAHTAPSRW